MTFCGGYAPNLLIDYNLAEKYHTLLISGQHKLTVLKIFVNTVCLLLSEEISFFL